MKDKGEEPARAPGSLEGRVVRVEAANGLAAGVTVAAVVAPYPSGHEPPDVIEVVFPTPRADLPSGVRPVPLTGPGSGSPAGFPAEPPNGSRLARLRECPLLLGALAIAAVGLAAALACQAWSRTDAGTRPVPARTAPTVQLPLGDILLPPASGTPSTGSTPAHDPTSPTHPVYGPCTPAALTS